MLVLSSDCNQIDDIVMNNPVFLLEIRQNAFHLWKLTKEKLVFIAHVFNDQISSMKEKHISKSLLAKV